MVRIPRTEASVAVQMANQPTMSPDALTGPGRALQGLGRAISGLSGAFEAASEPTDDDRFAAQMAAVKAHNEANDYLAERKATYTDDMDLTTWQADTMSGVDSIYGRHGSTVTHPKLQQGWALQTERFRGAANLDSSNFARGNQIRRNVESASIELGKMVGALDPGSPTFQAELNAIDQRIMTMPGASGQQREWVRKQVGDALAQKFLSGVMDEQGNVKPDAAGPAIEQINKLIEGWKQQQEAPQPRPGQPQQGQGVGPQSSLQPMGALPSKAQTKVAEAVQSGGGSAYEIAKSFVGRNEDDDARVLSAFFRKTSGQKLNPQNTAWCAAFVNATLAANGQKGTGTLVAKDFLKFGTPVDKPSEGDIVVLQRGKRNSWKGHVGFFAGYDSDGNVRVLGGNQGDEVNVTSFKRSKVIGFRRPSQAGGPIPDVGQYANASQGGMPVNLTAYSPQAAGSRMEGGYAASRPGPDGKAEVRTLADVAAGRSDYVTVAGNPRDYGKKFTIPEIPFVDAKGQRKTLRNVTAVVHDTGSAFRSAPEGRFDIPIDRDATDRQMKASHGMWKQAGIQFIPEGQPKPTQVADASGRIGAPSGGQIAERVASRIDGLVEPGTIDLDARKVLKNPDGSISTESSMSVEIDGSEVLIPTVINGKRVSADEAVAHYKKTGEHLGVFKDAASATAYAKGLSQRQSQAYGNNRPTNTIPGQQTAQAGELSPQEWSDQKRTRQELAPPGTLPSPNAAAGPVYRSRPSLLGDAVDSLSKALPKLIKANEKYQETLKAAIRVTNMIAGQEPFNPYSEEDRKLVNDVFTLGDLDNRMFAGDPDALAKGVEIAQRLNFAPKPLAEALLGMVKTTDPEQAQRRVAGYMASASILARNPNAFAKAEGGKDLTRETEDYVALTRSGRTEQEALLRLDEMRSPDWQAKAKVRKEYADEAVKSITLSTVTDYFDQSMLPFTTPDAVEGDMMLDAFTEKFREHYVRIGDVESAKALAANDLKKTYGVSSEVGNGQVMAYPPETVYPQIGGSHKYLKRDLEQTVRGYINSTKPFTDQADEKGSQIEADRIRLIVDGRTREEARAGKPPTYGIMYQDDNGVWQMMPSPNRWGLAPSDIDSERGAWMRALQKKRDEALPRIQERDEFRKTLDENAPHLMLRKGAQGLIDFFKGNGELPQGDTGIAP